MARLSIQLTDDIEQVIKQKAKKQGISASQYGQNLIKEVLGKKQSTSPLSKAEHSLLKMMGEILLLCRYPLSEDPEQLKEIQKISQGHFNDFLKKLE